VNSQAAERAKQGFHFMNCGADIVAVTSWMTEEMRKFHALMSETKEHGEGKIFTAP
jgi:4-hydroxy-2-oxoheptanedioate aldolase